MKSMTRLMAITGLFASSMLFVSAPSFSSPFFHNEIRGSLLMSGCSSRPSLLVNGRRVPGGHLRLTRIRGGYSYRLRLSWMTAMRSVSIRPVVSSSRCRGRWNPAVRTVRISSPRMRRAIDFRFVGRTVTPPPTRIIRISMASLTRLLTGTFRGMQIRINNYGRRHGNSWHKPRDSWVQLPRRLGGRRQVYTITEYRSGPYRYYVRDVNLNRVWFDHNRNHLRMNLEFESRGTEIKGRCAGHIILCAVGSDKAAPDVQMNRAKVTISMRPRVTRDGRSITYGDLHVRFRARIQAQGVCRAGPVDICYVITKYKREIPRQVENAIYQSLNSNALRQQVANAIRRILPRNMGRIMSAYISGNNLILRVARSSR